MTSLTVIAPNARRCTVKVTPNQQFNAVLEESCLHLGYDPNFHDLTHRGKVLDGSIAFRLSGLSSNATLELTRSKMDKSLARPVDVALQVDGGRFIKQLKNDLTLMDMLRAFGGEAEGVILEDGIDGTPVCQYMNKQVKGELELKKTTLKSLGINDGRVLIRYMRVQLSDEERAALQEQHVKEEEAKAALLKKYEAKKIENEQREEEIRKREEAYAEERRKLEAIRLAEEEARQQAAEEAVPQASSEPTPAPSVDTAPALTPSVTNSRIERLQQLYNQVEAGQYLPEVSAITGSENASTQNTDAASPRQPEAKKARVEEKEAPLPKTCDRNPVYFKVEEAVTHPEGNDAEDESFFEVGADDVKVRRAVLTQEVKAATNRALVPQSYVENKNRERKQAAYRRSVIRFMLPGRCFLQGSFISTEPTSELYKFLHKYLTLPAAKTFSLIMPVNCKVPDSTDGDLITRNIAPKATLLVKVDTDVEIVVNSEVPKVTVAEADENSKEWLTGNTIFKPFEPVVQDNGVEMRSIPEHGQSEGVAYAARPHTAKKNMPKWFKGK
ncbi:hypothetical protein QR680_006171 [Steinernema hermaphroditum]|uniref:TUG ubiquitin-like domain-containing protein n=1 Tax=Steinernema hermaphroditum TaxID=289476 RepID=A0AA39LWN4_9BILA|nr:hypothetical protein QR680_006171 [Steinernema hermaphroditum]